MKDFDILTYLAGLTTFTFDRAVLQRVAIDCRVIECCSPLDITEEERDRCLIALYETIIFGPWQTANTKSKHGDWELSVGSQVITAATVQTIKSALQRLYRKYNLADKEETLSNSAGRTQWIGEYD